MTALTPNGNQFTIPQMHVFGCGRNPEYPGISNAGAGRTGKLIFLRLLKFHKCPQGGSN